jgi:hypothetical protein
VIWDRRAGVSAASDQHGPGKASGRPRRDAKAIQFCVSANISRSCVNN